MNTRQRLGIAAALVAVSALLSVLAAPRLPDPMVTHWNAAGESDGTMTKPLALALVPALGAVTVAALALLPRIDPLGENVRRFRAYYDWFVVTFAGFLLAIHLGVVAFNLGYAVDITMLVVAAVAVLFYYLGVMLEHAEPNWFVGIRTPWTMSSEEVWRRTHDLAGTLFKLTALVALVGLLFGEFAVYFLVGPALATAGITLAYSYYAYRQLDDPSGTPVDPGG